MDVKIEKGIPVPPVIARNNAWSVANRLRSMDIGDSFVRPIKNRGYITEVGRKIGIRVTTRVISNTEVRVWRIS